jgi:hypothetical protein
MDEPNEGTAGKALRINTERRAHGTFAEIGAGQEVARWFFRVGGASATVAKTISAYDMLVSDAIYGPSDHYVSRQRLQAMLDDEYKLLLERLGEKRGKTSQFFVLADTVATRRESLHQEGHGWMGARFQHRPEADPSDVIIHLRMLDKEPAQEQETLGIMGVNLLYGGLYLHPDPGQLLRSLFDDLGRSRIEVDMIRLSGPAFGDVDNRLMTLRLLEQGHTEAVMFSAEGEVVQPAEVLYQRPVLIERGSFRPITYASLDILEVASRLFTRDLPSDEPPVVVMEMSLRNLSGERLDHSDFLARVEILSHLKIATMISSYARYYALAEYLHRYTSNAIVFAMGVPNLRQLFDQRYYKDLDGGILEAMGRLFKSNVRLCVYPSHDEKGQHLSADALAVDPAVQTLYQYLLENKFIQPTEHVERENLHLLPQDVLAKIQGGEPGWEKQMPREAADLIKRRRYFGYTEKAHGSKEKQSS